jgi:hypothetical protein
MAQTFTASHTAVAAGTNKHLATLWVAATLAKTIKIRRIWCMHNTTATVTGVSSIISLYMLTARTSGTNVANNIVKHDTANATAIDAAVEWSTGGSYTTGTQMVKMTYSLEEMSLTGFSAEEYTAIPGFVLLYNSGADSAVEPITFAAGTAVGISVFSATTLTSSLLDVFCEFTQE